MQKFLSQAIAFSSVVVCNGYEVDEFGNPQQGVIRLAWGDAADEQYEIADQVIEIDSDGEASIKDVDGNDCTLSFKVCIPIREVDFPKKN